jgi:hypothetical protein
MDTSSRRADNAGVFVTLRFFADPKLTPTQARQAGWVMLVLGWTILLAGALFTVLPHEMPIPGSWLPAGTRIERNPAAETGSKTGIAMLTLGLLVFGTLTMVLGIWQVVHGRSNRRLLRARLVLHFLFMLAGAVAAAILGRPIGRVGQ